MSAKKKQADGRKYEPLPRQEIEFRGEKFFTRNLGATDPFHGNWVWFAVGSWTHGSHPGAFSDLLAAVADRFDLWTELGLSYAQRFRSDEQNKAVQSLWAEIRLAAAKQGVSV